MTTWITEAILKKFARLDKKYRKLEKRVESLERLGEINMNWRCPRCGYMNIEYRGEMRHCPFGGLIKNYRCNFCQQYFCVIDDGKALNEAFDPHRRIQE